MKSSVEDFLSQYEKALADALAETPLPEGLLDTYAVLECVGVDPHKEIYIVRRREDGLKGLLRITTEESPEQAASEAALLSELSHPAIPKVLFFDTAEGRTFVVRSFFEGESLETMLQKHNGRLPPRDAVPIIIALCDILRALHGHHPPIIHRDIKPQNIIVGPGGDIYLVDFGISRVYNKKSRSDTVPLGTEPYAPPEQYGFMQTDLRSDLYSLGMVLLRMLTAEPDREKLSEVRDSELREVLRVTIALDPGDRYQRADALKAALVEWQQHSRRHTRLLVLGSIGAVLLAALTGFFAYRLGYDKGAADVLAPAPPGPGISILSYEEQLAPITFTEQNLALAIRNELNKDYDAPVLLMEARHVSDLYVVGISVLHHAIAEFETKVFQNEDPVALIVNNFLTTPGDIASLADLSNLTALRRLTLYSQRITDLSPLTGLPLISLRLADNLISTLAPLKDMSTLEVLDVGLNPLSDLRPLARLTRLKEVDLRHTRVSDLSPLGDAVHMETLYLDHTNVRDVSPLAAFPKLRTLSLGPLPAEGLKDLPAFAGLRTLSLYGPEGSLRAGDLPLLPTLETLSIEGAGDLSLEGLAGVAPQLLHLSLSGSHLSGLSELEALVVLQSLDLSGTDIADLRSVAGLSDLNTLNLRYTQIRDLTPLRDREGKAPLTIYYGDLPEVVLAPLAGIEGITLEP